WQLKREILDRLWNQTKNSPEQAAFAQFKRHHGESLARHATFEAISEYFAAKGLYRPDHWPQSYRDVRTPQVDAFRHEHSELINFHAWLQWLADEQLATAAYEARKSEMEIGLCGDLAVGADRSGSEIWAAPEHYAK